METDRIDDLTVREEKFKFGGQEYVLREASEPAVIEYRRIQFQGLKISADGKPVPDSASLVSLSEGQLKLVCLSVFNGDGKLADESVVRAFPHRLIKQMFSRLEKMSDLEAGEPRDIEGQIAELQKKLEESKQAGEREKN